MCGKGCERPGKLRELTVAITLTVVVCFAFCVTQPPPALSEALQGESQLHDSDRPDAQLMVLEADIAANRFQQVEPRLSEYLEHHPTSSTAHYDLGYVQFRNHEIGSSIRELSKSLELDPKNAEAHKVLALDCSIIGRYDIAETELQESAKLKPDSAEIHYFLARTYYTKGVYPLAKTEFETSIRLDSSFVKAYSNLGITMEALGDNANALRNYQSAIRLEDQHKLKSEWPYIYLSAFYNRQKDATNALAYSQEALKINPASDTAYFELAKAFRNQKDLQKAADAAGHAIDINSRVPDYFYVRGLVLRELGKAKESEEALAKYSQLRQNTGAQPKYQSEESLGFSDPR